VRASFPKSNFIFQTGQMLSNPNLFRQFGWLFFYHPEVGGVRFQVLNLCNTLSKNRDKGRIHFKRATGTKKLVH